MQNNRWGLPDLGLGVGLRTTHYAHILSERPEIGFFEILTENYLDTGGRPLYMLDQIAERYPTVMHGVSMSIGSTDPINFDYLDKVKALAERTGSLWVSDHICWTGVLGRNTHDLLPLPYTEESLAHSVERIKTIQDYLERPLVLENPSTYLEFADSDMTEWKWVARMAEEPATPTRAPISSTPTRTTSWIRCGSSSATPFAMSACVPPFSSGTPTSRPSRSSIRRC
jgi:uncharacterized protein (UPF0276 family)